MAKTLREQGRAAAVELLRQLEDLDGDACCIDSGIRAQMGYGAQLNPVADFLKMIRERASVEFEAGAGEILTDYLASVVGGAIPDVDFYEERISAEVAHLGRAGA